MGCVQVFGVMLVAKLAKSLVAIGRFQFFLAPAAFLHSLVQIFLLRGDAIAHEAVALLDLFIAAFDHAADHYIRLRIELVQLHA